MINNYTLADTVGDGKTYSLIKSSTIHPDVKKSKLVMNYIELPVGFRFDTNPDDLARSFSVTLGGRIGYLYEGLTKLKYREDRIIKKDKDIQPHGMTRFRYGVYSRIGIGGFDFFGFYNLAPLFEKNKGPAGTTMTTLTVGISINGL